MLGSGVVSRTASRPVLVARSPGTVRLYDGLAIFWVVLWLVVGVWTGWRLWQLASISDNVAQSGRALDAAGQALGQLSRIPVVGEVPQRIADGIRQKAADVITTGEANADRMRQLAVLLGVTIAVAPSASLVALYVPARRRYGAEARSVRAAYRTFDPDAVAALLAHRAVATLPLDVVLTLAADPEGDLRAGRFTALATAELARLGLEPALLTGDRQR
jgi:hypothetical protein